MLKNALLEVKQKLKVQKEEEWESVGYETRKNKISTETVCLRFLTKSKKNTLKILIGREICEIISVNKDSRFDLMISKGSPGKFRLIKKLNGKKIWAPNKTSNVYTIEFMVPPATIKFAHNLTISVHFEIESENSIIIDSNIILGT